MNETQYLLVVLAEEAAEIVQRATKTLRFGIHEVQPGQDEDNLRRLEREVADLEATAQRLRLTIRDEDKAAKLEKLDRYMAYSREIGLLDKEPQ